MRLKQLVHPYFFVGSIFMLGCTEPELTEHKDFPGERLNLNAESSTSREGLDSATREEGKIKRNYVRPKYVTPNANDPINYSLTATVSATTTYSGYSVQNIKDGDQNTTVGPQFSWANDFDRELGIRLPQSVYVRFFVPRMIEKIEIYTSKFYELQNYTILYRVNAGNTWTTLVTVIGNTADHRVHNFALIQDVAEVQIKCERGPEAQTIYGRLNEVEIYGPVFDLPPFPDPVLLD